MDLLWMWTRALAAALPALALMGCAGIEVVNVGNPTADENARGFRYYDTSPFILVYADGQGALTSQLLYLPDSTKKRSIRPYAYGASNQTTLTFDKGRLTGAKSVVDETAIPNAVIAGLEKIALASIKASNAGRGTIPPPMLYRIVYRGGMWDLEGGQTVDANGQPSAIKF